MIVRPRLHWLRMLFIWRGSLLPDIAPRLIGLLLFSTGVTVLHGHVFAWKIPLNFVPFSLIGLTLAIFLGFRNSTSYARYWEARVLWGGILNETRSLTRGALTLLNGPVEVRPFVHRLIAFVHAARHQLRGTDPRADFARLLPADEVERLMAARSKPMLLALMAGEWLRAQRQAGRLDVVLLGRLDEHLSRLSDAFGGCERIAGTPIPFTYSVIIHRTIYLYCVLLPFGLVDSIGAMTPVIVAFIAYTFLALEALGAEIEEPFGIEPNDLALDAMSRNIEGSLREMLGDRGLPPALEPVDCILT